MLLASHVVIVYVENSGITFQWTALAMKASSTSMGGRKDQQVADTQPVPGWLASGVLHVVFMSFFVAAPVPIYAPPGERLPLVLQASFPHASVEQSSVAVVQPPGDLSNHSESVVGSTEKQAIVLTPASKQMENTQVDQSRPREEGHAMAYRHVPRRALKTSQAPRDWPSTVDMKQMDRIVERFIQYDVGQLSGENGRQALIEFQSLGSESVPSLVRGLNHAARIQYSCPVGVLSEKLVQLLLQGKDSSLTEYVVRNLGQGVPETAPHQRRLDQLRRFIAQQANKSLQPVRDELRNRHLPVSREMLQLVEEMTLVPPDQMEQEIRYGDPVSRIAALIGLLRRADELPPSVRMQLAEPLVHLFAQEKSVTAALSHEVLVKLANGLDFGNRPQDVPLWTEYWRGMEANLEGIPPENRGEELQRIPSQTIGPSS